MDQLKRRFCGIAVRGSRGRLLRSGVRCRLEEELGSSRGSHGTTKCRVGLSLRHGLCWSALRGEPPAFRAGKCAVASGGGEQRLVRGSSRAVVVTFTALGTRGAAARCPLGTHFLTRLW